MDSKEFLNNLLLEFKSKGANVLNIGFNELADNNLNILGNFTTGKEVICISSNNFHDKTEDIFSSVNKNFLESIISLPIFNNDDNLLIVVFNSLKTDNNCLFIDESDSLLHKDDSVDWKYVGDELIGKISTLYDQFLKSDTSVILDIDSIIVDAPEKNTETPKKTDHSEFLSLLSDSNDVPVRKNRIISDELADGLLSLKQNQSVRDEISKNDIKASEMPQSSNFSYFHEVMYYNKRQNPENLLYKDDKRLIDGDVPFRRLKKIADLHNIYVKNDNDSILIATCKRCDSKLVYYNREISDFNGEVYIELINVSDTVSMDYLYEYLASSNGLGELLYFSKQNSYITPDDIKNVKIPIPPLEVQKEIVNVARESREFFKTVELLKKEFNSNILDYKHMKNSLNELKGEIVFDSETNEITTLSRSWRHAYKGLIWPLAISYLSATKGGFETVEKKNNYLILFEFIAAFNSIILLSGLPDDVYQKNFKKIWNSRNPKEYNQMTFANWVYLSKNLAEVYSSNNFTVQLDEKLFDAISSEKLLNMLEFAKDLRNDESHGSHSNVYEAKEIIEKLDVYLEDIFDILEIYSDYKLIYVTGDYKDANHGYSHRVILLNGPCAQPIYDNIIFNTTLHKESLYLYNPKNNKKLLLKDSFVKFKPTDENNKHWALFVYYSCDKKEFNAFYKCFQSREDDIRVSISSLESDILNKK